MKMTAWLTSRTKWAVIVLTIAGLAIWWGVSQSSLADNGKLRLTVIDVGQGDSLLLQTPSGRTILIDGGGTNDENQASTTSIGDRVVLPFLRYQGINYLDLVVLTHPHGDHVGGLPDVLDSLHTGAVLDGTRLPYPSAAYQRFLETIRTRHIVYAHAYRGMHIDMRDGVVIDVLNPPAEGFPYGTEPDNTTVNNYSVVLRVTYHRTHFMLDGDAQNEAEQSMLSAYGDLQSDVLKCGHHGAGNATSDVWLDRVRPKFAAISCGAHNHFGHPHPETLARLKTHSVLTFRTDKNGAITFVSDGNTVKARALIP